MNLSERYMKSQSGRTMLEILIVVALVGLLSLLPLEIYNYVIDKYRSNVLKDEILQRSADLKQQIDNHKKIFNLDKWEPYSKIGVPIDIVENDAYEQNSIGIQITHIEKRICNMTLDGLENLEKIRVNDILYNIDSESLCKGNDKIILYFNLIPSHSIRKKSLEGCPANTPKNADPNTCECDLTQRYFQESTNECICWSEVEIDGECVKSCTTSADCDNNEICENHICVKYENTTTMEPMNTTEVPETTYITSTATPETTSSTPLSSTTTTSVYETTSAPYTTTLWYETTSAPYTTTSWYETTTSTYTTTSQYETTTFVCPEEKPHYDTDTHTCVECLTDTDCENMAVCSSDKICICQITESECTTTDFNPTQCVCCPPEAPVYDSVSGMCKTCDEMHPEWAETGSGYDVTTRQCWAYCRQQKAGIVLLVDRSPSTKSKSVLDEATNTRKYLNRLIPEAVYKLRIPEGIKTAVYRHDKDSSGSFELNRLLKYDKNSQFKIDSARRKIDNYIYNVDNTSFKMAITDVVETVCPKGDKLIIIMWTDGVLTDTKSSIKKMKSKCKNARFYYIGPNENTYSDYFDQYYQIQSLPDDYIDLVNNYMRQEGCIPKK